MPEISRRDFLTRTAIAAGAAAIAGHRAQAAETAPRIRRGTDLVTLGNTGIRTSVLGMGTGSNGVRRSSRQLRLGQAEFTRVIRHGIDRGLRYVDTADQYGTHIFVREALKGVPREDLFIQTKTRALHPEVAKVDLDRFRQELGTDYIDSLLMHGMGTETWPADMRSVMDVLAEAKEKKIVRAVGISCHGIAPLRASTGCDWLDTQLAPMNPFGAVMDAPAEEYTECFQALHDQGKGVLGMKLFACGGHVTPDERRQSLEFVLRLGCVDAFPIGFESPEQIDDVLDTIEKVLS
ncbi:MAG TPA: aldo/keto reductase [Thermoguttaceae bacterium]|nr:aldo/keto reductase [Thermoguttaceae bacterium]